MRQPSPCVLLAGTALALSGCHRPQPSRSAQPAPHYVLGAPWQGDGGTWFYPREQPGFHTTGLAIVAAGDDGAPTADGERADPEAMTAAMQTLPLPAVVSVRDLANGRTLLVRVNALGPGDPRRLVALSPGAAAALGIAPGQPTPVEVALDEARTRDAVGCVAGHPSLDLAAAPVQAVSEQALPPPGQGAAGAVVRNAGAGSGPADRGAACDGSLPRVATAGPAWPVRYEIDAGSFSGGGAAATMAARTGGRVERSGSGRTASYAVRIGPFEDVRTADAALDRLLSAGVTGARITVE